MQNAALAMNRQPGILRLEGSSGPRRVIVRGLVPRGLYGPVQGCLDGVLGD
ncbi:hypothetical protein [Streptomyces sp. NPDC000888]